MRLSLIVVPVSEGPQETKIYSHLKRPHRGYSIAAAELGINGEDTFMNEDGARVKLSSARMSRVALAVDSIRLQFSRSLDYRNHQSARRGVLASLAGQLAR
jgi:hypothetical protein